MTSPFRLDLNGGEARAVRVSEVTELRSALRALELQPPRPTVVVVGGAAGLDEGDTARLRSLFVSAIVPVMTRRAAVGVDGGTLSGVMRLFGEAHSMLAASFPLVGVVAAGTVRMPGGLGSPDADTVVEPHHTHFVIVPGDDWGAESPWIADIATVLAAGAPSITVLINGGEIAYSDAERSVRAGRDVIAVAGSGRTADMIAEALAGATDDRRASALAESGLVRAVPVDDPAGLRDELTAVLGRGDVR